MDARDPPWQNLCPRPMHVKRANHLIRPATTGSRFVPRGGDELCPAFVQGTCLAPGQSQEHPDCTLKLRLGRGRLVPTRAAPSQHDRVQSQPVQGASLTRSARGLASSDFAFRDSTCRTFPGLFLPKRAPDLTTRLSV